MGYGDYKIIISIKSNIIIKEGGGYGWKLELKLKKKMKNHQQSEIY